MEPDSGHLNCTHIFQTLFWAVPYEIVGRWNWWNWDFFMSDIPWYTNPPSGNQTWQWDNKIKNGCFNGKMIYTWWNIHCYVWLSEGITWYNPHFPRVSVNFSPHITPTFGSSWSFSSFSGLGPSPSPSLVQYCPETRCGRNGHPNVGAQLGSHEIPLESLHPIKDPYDALDWPFLNCMV